MTEKLKESDAKLQNLFRSLAAHLASHHQDIAPALDECAHDYAMNNIQASRVQYLSLHHRKRVIRQIIGTVLQDKMLSAETRKAITDAFPDIETKPTAAAEAAKPATLPQQQTQAA